MNREGQPPEHHELHCKEKDRPISRRTCNDYPCKDDVHRSENQHTVLQVQNDPEISNGILYLITIVKHMIITLQVW